jgi:hypothetical protein
MSHRERKEQEFWNVAKAIIGDAVARGILRDDGEAVRCSFSTVLADNSSVRVTISSYIPPPPAGDLPPEAYLRFEIAPSGSKASRKGCVNVAFRCDRGWVLYGDFEIWGERSNYLAWL